MVNAKTKAAFRNGITPVLCVGEGFEVRQAGNQVDAHARALRAGVEGLPAEQSARSSSPTSPSGPSAPARWPGRRMHRKCARRSAPGSPGSPGASRCKIRVLYGGSVKSNNMAGIMVEGDVDGALVGGASLDAAEFVNIVRFESHLVTD